MTITDNTGMTLWLTGLPCSGKTTIAQIVKGELEERGVAVEWLDGDDLRKHFSAGVGFTIGRSAAPTSGASCTCAICSRSMA